MFAYVCFVCSAQEESQMLQELQEKGPSLQKMSAFLLSLSPVSGRELRYVAYPHTLV